MEHEKNIQIVQRMLLDNQSDMLDIDRRYKTLTARLQAKQELRMEREELLHQLERLTGRKMPKVDEIAAEIPKNSEGPDNSAGDKEPVKT